MKKLMDLITEVVEQGFEACGYEKSLGKATLSNRPDLCEYQCNGAMGGARLYHKAPIMIANDVVAKLADRDCFEEVTAVNPGFINLKVSGSFLAGYLAEMDASERLGIPEPEKKETIVIDYGGANVAKPLHVGHLRSAIIGESMKRLSRFLGHEVIGDVHLGDWGLQMGLIIEELKDRQPELPYFDEGFTGEYPNEAPFTIGELEEIYPAASARSKTDEAFAKRAHDATFKLQNGDRGYLAIWNHILNVSVADLKKNYGRLNVTFDIWKKESDAQPYIPEMVQMMKDRGFAYESQGALVVDVKEEADTKEVPPCILLKSDGATLYSTTDLATLVEREKLFKPDRVLYVVDKRQALHFTQVFRCAKKTGIVRPETELNFLGFGTMNGKDGKPFKTRDGGVMRLEYLIKEISDAVYEKIMENRSVDESDARRTAEIIGLAALKYGDLSNQASKDYVFDVDRFISFEGDTGPYILYTIVRIKSIQAKYEALEDKFTGKAELLPAASESEKELQLMLSRVSDAVLSAFEEQAPHKICQYIYDLSNAFNRFYHETRILAEEDKERQAAYIRLLSLTRRILETCIDLLGFEAPDRM
ncbi:arginine--tRNA ligase [Fusibacillus kribbianus]|uniref:Arginine--tRNA ligase n=1 Tax=Fusibacillus kribbianus TaxID=3044208 RepID=A0AAP4B7E7_9FIRM|nr:arginine--tRNA ligase [Ruminococcus sp. YH-rum2234]MDI9241261.1 arginine--tRNA ligase [Ruminococcus sp. YH-rum2234]